MYTVEVHRHPTGS